METATYAILSRQSGLLREMRIVANNVANAATTGYREGQLVFSEMVQDTRHGASVSMARARIQTTSTAQGALTQTAGPLDMAIEGDGFFMVETPDGERLTRAGSFALSTNGDLVTPAGHLVLGPGGAPLFLPPMAATIHVGPDGTLSADGQPMGQIGVFQPTNPAALVREDGVLFRADDGADPILTPRVLQGFLEGSNVNAISQVARMVEIQRAYELGQSFLEREDDRVRNTIKALIR
ncbi:MAG TPA: flagellar basal-body rod protein FlgF [Rhodobacteraceae bacterium]|nr:flagellar basal-body rod protein FlgF [Paracoccaceae bacterium]